jgi:hypothetical protein
MMHYFSAACTKSSNMMLKSGKMHATVLILTAAEPIGD